VEGKGDDKGKTEKGRKVVKEIIPICGVIYRLGKCSQLIIYLTL
jgi:hypothetical protein